MAGTDHVHLNRQKCALVFWALIFLNSNIHVVSVFLGLSLVKTSINSKNSISTFSKDVACYGFIGPLRQYFSLYRAVSKIEGERREIVDERKMPKQPHLHLLQAQ